jgi:tetratricopeptide (TPR) repeat protein
VLFLKKGSGKADALIQREVNAEKIIIKPISHDGLAYFISDERPLWQKIAQARELVLAQSQNTDESASYHFYLAKIYLLAGQNQKALFELEIWRGLNSRQAVRKDRDIVLNVLREDIFHLLLWNAMQALIEGEKESALSLWEKASQFAFNRLEWQGKIYFTKAEAWYKKGNIEEAKRFYLKTLAFCRSRDDEVQVINKIKELFSFSSCYIIWREQNEWHLRWLADGKNEFSGMISSLPPCLKKKRTWLEANGSVKSANKEILFHSKIESNKLQGFNFTAAALSKIRFLLKIDGDINILNRIILADGMEPPKKMPFFIE